MELAKSQRPAASLGFAVIIALQALAASASALEVKLDGSWSGGGTVVLPSGAQERARCRASFAPQSVNTYRMFAVCATSSTRIEQSASLRRTGGNSFSGHFHNAEYNISGSINVSLNGNRLSASLNGGGGSAQLSLGR